MRKYYIVSYVFGYVWLTLALVACLPASMPSTSQGSQGDGTSIGAGLQKVKNIPQPAFLGMKFPQNSA